MIVCKAFEPGLVCRGYQFHVGLNTTDEANCRQNGFHCAANPLDCLSYYGNMDRAEYWLVDAGGDVDEEQGVLHGADDPETALAQGLLHVRPRIYVRSPIGEMEQPRE